MRIAAVLAAAGAGVRLGYAAPKALVPLAGEPLLAHALRPLLAAGVERVVVAAPPELVTLVQQVLVSATGQVPVDVVAGGRSRRESVQRCLSRLGDADAVLVHDAARPLVPPDVVDRVVGALNAGGRAVVPVMPLADSVKQVEGRRVVRTLPRASLRAVQTPQGFRTDLLRHAHANWAGPEPTDDAAMLEAAGVEVVVVDGDAAGFKVTDPGDLRHAEWVLAARASQ